jgi:phage shock protein A
MSSMSDRSAFEHFDRMAERIEETERKALAAAELQEEFTADSLSRDFEALEFHGTQDQQLLELKRKMGKLPPGESAEPRQLEPGEDVQDAEVVEEEEEGQAQ